MVEKLDIGYDVMREIHPEIIYARIKGFGTSGPYAQYKCMDMVAQAAAGAFSITGEADGPPMRPGPTMGDAGTGMQAALAIAAAWAQKQRTGKGQLIELSMQEAMTYYLRTAVSRTGFGAAPTPRTGNGDNPFVSLYPCRGNGANDYVFVMAVNPRMREGVRRAIGLEDDSADMREAIAAWTRTRSKGEAMAALAAEGVCASQVFETHELFTDPHLLARDFIQEVEHADHGTVRLLGWPARMSRSSVEMRAAPRLGEHTDQVLADDLGLDADAIATLRGQGAIGVEAASA